MEKCPYCARPLRMWGLRCRACRRYVLRWPHIIILIALCLALAVGMLELLFRLTA